MGPKPLVGRESPEDVEIWLQRMENFFREFGCNKEQKMETLNFLVEGRSQKWWNSTSASFAKASELLSLRQGKMSIDDYQQKFFDLLSYSPEIFSSSEMKYNMFLQGLNPEIHGHVAVGDDMTYEGLVS
ncbi:uncharacterized protein [Henckelia pumila]|uniref:uncharacterized protein n=1 Tax=Henckelia pumila TaxID=405737 RepID=UPI003C6DD429